MLPRPKYPYTRVQHIFVLPNLSLYKIKIKQSPHRKWGFCHSIAIETTLKTWARGELKDELLDCTMGALVRTSE